MRNLYRPSNIVFPLPGSSATRVAAFKRMHNTGEIHDALNGDRSIYDVSDLGAGGCGKVVSLKCRRSGDELAIKTPLKSTDIQTRLIFTEARALGRLSDVSGVVGYLGHKISKDGSFVAMDRLHGRSLSSMFTQISLENFLIVMAYVADALSKTHEIGVVHRDLKPENIFIQRTGYPRLIDFGLSLKIGQKPNSVCGTPEFIAPESLALDPVSPKMDVFAFGRILYEKVSGKALKMSLDQVLSGAYSEFASSLPDLPLVTSKGEPVPPVVPALIDLCTHPDPNMRPDAKTILEVLCCLTS